MRLFAVITIVFATVLLFTADTFASQRFEVTADYDVAETGKVVVTQTYTVTNTGSDGLDSLTVVTPSTKLSAINARYPDGTTIPAQTSRAESRAGDVKFQYQAIKLEFPRRTRGQGVSWQFTLSYVAEDVMSSFGDVQSLFLPGLGQEVPDTPYTLTLRHPGNFGEARLLPSPTRSGSEAGKRFLTFNRADLANGSLATIFGDSATHGVTIELPLKNNFILPRNLKVALPPELSSQRLESVKFEPAPKNTTLDRDGNLYGIWQLKPFQSQTVKIALRFKTENLRYDFAQSGQHADIPSELARYTEANRYWPNNRIVQQAAAELTDNDATVAETVQAVGSFMTDSFRPKVESFDLNQRRDASTVLVGGGEINALEYSDVTIALLRSLEIPARLVLGETAASVLSPEASRHAWVEAFVPGVGWVSVDAYWSELFGVFDYHYMDRIALHVMGDKTLAKPARWPWEDGEVNVVALSGEPKEFEAEVTADAQRYVLLPGVILESAKVTYSAPQAKDNFALSGLNEDIWLGSFAPFETKQLRRLSFGSMGALELTVVLDEEPAAEFVANPNWWPLIAFGGALAALGLMLQWRRSKGRRTPSPTSQLPVTPGRSVDGEDEHAAERYHE